jgi:hypothetical protein
MRDLKAFLAKLGRWHTGYLDAFVQLLLVGNRVKQLWHANRNVLSQVLQVRIVHNSRLCLMHLWIFAILEVAS